MKALAFSSWNLNRALEIFDSGSILLTRCEANQSSKCLLIFLRSFQFLAMHHGVGAKLYNMRPKCHYLFHTAIQTKEWQINPFVFHCFEEESWLGRTKCIAKQCHGKTMQTRVLQRYLICLALYLENSRRQVRESKRS